MSFPIPDAALANHIAILGKTGSGKSNAAKTIAEILLGRGERVCAVDPTGTWWGLRLDREGKRPSGWSVVIFGGEHADLPLGAEHGAAIAETIGTSSTSAIVDVRLMTVAARTRFFTDFAEGLLRSNRGELTLVIDEAHLFAPQGRVADPRSGALLHAANNLVSLGRGIGLRIILVSQRPAKLHKDSLTQVETLVAMRLVAPQDRAAIREWVKDQADQAKGEEIIASLPGLAKGEAWVWSPELGLLERAKFPLVATFDSGTPLAGRAAPKLKPIDVSAVAARLKEVAADALANDPARLKAEAAKLRAEIARLQKAAQNMPENMPADPEALDAATRRGYEEGLVDGIAEGWTIGIAEALRFACAEIHRILGDHVVTPLADLLAGLKPIQDRIDSGAWALAFADASPPRPAGERPARAGEGASVAKTAPQPNPKSAAVRQPSPARPRAESASPGSGEAAITPAKRRILVALRQLEAIGRTAPEKTNVAWFAGASPKSSAFANNLGALRSAGLIDYPAGGAVALTEAGRAIVPPEPAPSHADLMNLVAGLLPPAQMRILQWLAVLYPGDEDKAELADSVGASPTSSAFANNLGRLRSLGLIDYPRPGRVVATEVLFP